MNVKSAPEHTLENVRSYVCCSTIHRKGIAEKNESYESSRWYLRFIRRLQKHHINQPHHAIFRQKIVQQFQESSRQSAGKLPVVWCQLAFNHGADSETMYVPSTKKSKSSEVSPLDSYRYR